MKKIAITLLVMSSLLVAKSVVKEESSGWKLVFETDDFDDKVKKCNLYSKNYSTKNIAGLVIVDINSKYQKQVIAFSGSFLGSNLVYRVDKNDSVYVSGYDIKANANYDELIKAFKNGKEVKIKVTPKNQFVNESMDTISLEGFERLYQLVETCNYK